ncbi:MAG: SpoIIE family protein phosphatase [Anaerolineae bacterium]|nr:MAG: SpoIIE family protein phosphatase [Anaerolineae bacterium]
MQYQLGRLRIQASLASLSTISYFVQGLAHRLELSDSVLFELELAVEEATTNIIHHAYHDNTDGEIEIRADFIDEKIQLSLVDWGEPFDPSKAKPFDMNAPIEARINGGMGLHLIHHLVDKVERKTFPKRGGPNVLILTKEIRRGGMQRERQREKQEFSAMRAVSEIISTGIELDDLLRLIVNKLVETIEAERGTLYLIDEEKGELFSRILLEDSGVLPEIRLKMGEGIAGHVAETGQTLNIADAYNHPMFNPHYDKVTGYRTQSILTLPMRNPKQKIIGVVQLVNKIGGTFTRRDEQLLNALASQAAISIENARLYAQEFEQQLLNRELEMAHNIQASFLPETVPQIEGWDIAYHWKPVREVAGDFYDFFQMDDGRLAILIADVSGKGIPAALFMALTVTVLRFGMSLGLHPAEMIHRANDLILHSQRSRMFATVFVGYIDMTSGKMEFASAGHNPPLLFRAETQTTEEITASGVAVGVFKSARYDAATVTLGQDDILVLFTDGITEIINADEEEYGEGRLSEVINENVALSAQELAVKIVEEAGAFAAQEGAFDDETLIVIKRTPAIVNREEI